MAEGKSVKTVEGEDSLGQANRLSPIGGGLFRGDIGDGLNPNRKNLVRLTESEAVDKAVHVLWNWRPHSDIFALKFGSGLPALLATIPGISMTDRIRNAHRLQGIKAGRLMSSGPAIVAGLCGTITANLFIQQDLLIAKTSCPTCLEMRAVSLQLVFGVLLPTTISLVGNYSVMLKASVKLPEVLTREYFQWNWRMLKKCKSNLYFSAFSQVVTVSVLLWLQRREWDAVNRKLEERMAAGRQL